MNTGSCGEWRSEGGKRMAGPLSSWGGGGVSWRAYSFPAWATGQPAPPWRAKQMRFCLPACHKTQPLKIRSPKPQALTLSQPSAGMHILLLRLTSACSAMLLYLSEEVMPEVMSRAWASQVRTPMVPSNGPSRNDLHVCMGCAWGDPQGTFAWPRANGFAPQEEQEEE